MLPKSKLSDRFPGGDVFFGTSPDLPRIVEIDVAKIVWNPDQPRKTVDPHRLRELADSIAANGLIHPIIVKRSGDDQYMIVAGERRCRAFGLLDRTTIPAIISDGDTDELALVENIQRQDLSPIDECHAVARLMEKHGYSQGDVARVLGKSRVWINELMALNAIAAPILAEAQAANLSKSVLIEIAREEDPARQLALLEAVRDGARTVRSLRATKKAVSRGDQEPTQAPNQIGPALRAGRKFADAISKLSAADPAEVAEILASTEQLLLRLQNLNDRTHSTIEAGP